LSLTDAAHLVTTRGRLMQAARTDGAMIAIQASEEEMATSLTAQHGGDSTASAVTIAAVNSPTSLVISGDAQAAQRIADFWDAQGRKVKHLTVSHAFHSPHMDEVLDEFHDIAAQLTFN
ncbi:acyltransferase domain-containing protein, partial [Streptomyces apocyni]|uniref:acyltransferase domain-containing protein n=1 Tax=Streptomyces apocyni TaxID=2654677 RepID=UPI0012EA7217